MLKLKKKIFGTKRLSYRFSLYHGIPLVYIVSSATGDVVGNLILTYLGTIFLKRHCLLKFISALYFSTFNFQPLVVTDGACLPGCKSKLTVNQWDPIGTVNICPLIVTNLL